MNMLQQPNRIFAEPLEGNYFVAAYPPFSSWKSAEAPALQNQLRSDRTPAPLGLYVHIPFCQRKCDYCYYLSYIQKSPACIDNYVNSLLAELDLYKQSSALAGQQLNYLYFGGGTPSLLSPAQLRKLTSGIYQTFSSTLLQEFTFECAPRTVRADFLEALRQAGVTRISMGVQSFDDHLLKLSGRIHLAQDAISAFHRMRSAGLDYINLDLMVGLPGETDESWLSSIRRTLELAPESITIYQTEIPHNTRLYHEMQAGQLPAPLTSWADKRRRLELAWAELEAAGYHLQSAYHAVKYPAKHPFLYQQYLWRGGDLLCLGVAAFGYFQGVHYQNETSLEQYYQKLTAGELPLGRVFPLSIHDQIVREFILQLKIGEVSVQHFREKFGVSILDLFAPQLKHLAAEGFLRATPFHVKLTTGGLLQVDRLLPFFYDSAFRNVRYT